VSLKVGDLVEVVGPFKDERNRHWIGRQLTVVSLFMFDNIECCYTSNDPVGWACYVLRKIDPPYDGNSAGDWSLVPWQPKVRERA
jgi:hypothetical protein